jgi:hypothetical protein
MSCADDCIARNFRSLGILFPRVSTTDIATSEAVIFRVQPPLRMHLLLSFLVFLLLVPKAEPASFGIPGTTQTISGYDTELGEDPICWTSTASTVGGGLDTPFPNPLISDFKIQGKVTLLRSCPVLNSITAEAPIEFQRGERLRTGAIYDFKVTITLNLDSLDGNAIVSDEGPLIAVQILVCNLGAGFCSPFIHEESNALLRRKGSTNRRTMAIITVELTPIAGAGMI